MKPVPIGLDATSPQGATRGMPAKIRLSPPRDDRKGSSFLRAGKAVRPSRRVFSPRRPSRDDHEGSSLLRVGRAVPRSRDDHEGSSFLRVGRAVRRSTDDHEGPSFRRGGKAVRRSRRDLRKRRLKSFTAALLLAAGPSAAVTWLMISPRFAVRELAVVTGERVPEGWVREALAPVVGQNLPRLPLAQAEQILRRHPWVRGADLRKDLPARLAVRVAERRAVAMLRAADGLHYLDVRGERIAAFDPAAGRAVDLPLISVTEAMLPSRENEPAAHLASSEEDASPRPAGAKSMEAVVLRSAVQLLSEIDDVDPLWASGLSEIEILGEEDFRIHSSALPFPVLVRAGTLHQRARRLEELLPHIVERFGAVAAVDLRFARRIIMKPSADSGSRGSRPVTAEYLEASTDHAQRG